LTVSEVFPVGAASGGQARSPSADGKSGSVRKIGQPMDLARISCKMTDGGSVRLYSKALVEENKRHRQRQDRVPKALNWFIRLAVSPEPESRSPVSGPQG